MCRYYDRWRAGALNRSECDSKYCIDDFGSCDGDYEI